MYKCECGKEYFSIEGLRAHRYRCSIGKKYYLEEKNYIVPNEDGEYECECGKSFTTKGGLSWHVLHCKECSNNFYNKIRKHLDDTLYKDDFECQVCHKHFNTLTGLSLHSNKSGHKMTDEQISKRNYKSYGEGKFECKICGKKFDNCLGLHLHLKSHGIITHNELLQYYIDYEGFEIPKCKICGKPAKLANFTKDGPLFRNTCCDEYCLREYLRKVQKDVYIKHPEKREERRLSRIDYLNNKENFVNTAWGKRASGELSYIEQWFYDNIIVPYALEETFQIINEYSFYGYSFDYAFIDLRLDVEFDGGTHFRDDKRIENDKQRDAFTKSKNWKVYRITYKEINDNPNKVILDFLLYLDSLK